MAEELMTESLGGVKCTVSQKAKMKHRWRKERIGDETFGAWVRRKLLDRG